MKEAGKNRSYPNLNTPKTRTIQIENPFYFYSQAAGYALTWCYLPVIKNVRKIGYIFWWRKCKSFHLEKLLKQVFGQEFVTC